MARRLISRAPNRTQAAWALLRNPAVECLVSSVSLRGSVRHGLAFQSCDAAAILPRHHDRDADAFVQGIDVLIKANWGRFVVMSDDSIARAALGGIDSNRIILVATEPDDPEAQAKIGAGGAVVIRTRGADGPHLALFDRGELMVSAPIDVRPRIGTEASLIAAALAYAVGQETRRPRPGLEPEQDIPRSGPRGTCPLTWCSWRGPPRAPA